MAPSLVRPDPPFLQIAAHIRTQILSGELREGDKVPSSRQITQQWGVAIATASKALSVLRDEGYTRAIPGVGTVVRASETLRHAPRGRLVAFRRDGRIYPPGDRVKILAAEMIVAPPHVADAIAVRKGTQVIRRHRLTWSYRRPVSVSTSWFDAALAEVAPLLLSMDRVVGGTTAYVEKQTGRTVTAGRDQVTARPATDGEAADLGLAGGSPVLHGRTWFYDSAGSVMEFGEFVTVPGRWTSSEYELAAELAEGEAGTTRPGR